MNEKVDLRNDDAWLFAYGSLVDPDSCERTVGKALHAPIPVMALGLRRGWTALSDNSQDGRYVCDTCGGLPQLTLSVGIWLEASSHCAGVLVWVGADKWDALDERETGYERVRLSADALGDPRGMRGAGVWTYLGVPPRAEWPEGTIISASYVARLATAFNALGSPFHESYQGELLPSSVPVQQTKLVLPADRAQARTHPPCRCRI